MIQEWKQNSLKRIGFKIEFKSTEHELDMPQMKYSFFSPQQTTIWKSYSSFKQ